MNKHGSVFKIMTHFKDANAVEIVSSPLDMIESSNSSSVIYALAKSIFQLKDVTLPFKYIWNSHHTKPLQLKCLCMLRCKASVTFLAMLQSNGEVTQCALCGLSLQKVGKFLQFSGLKIFFLRHKRISASPLLPSGRNSQGSSVVLI